MTNAVPTDRLGPLPAFLERPPPGPVVRVTAPTGDQIWLVGDYRLGRQVLTDRRFSRAAAAQPAAPKVNTVNPAPSSMMSMDGAGHARLRRLVAAAFAPRRIAALEPEIERLVNELLDDVVGAGPPADLVASFTAPLPIEVISSLLGVPAEDRTLVQQWAGVLFDVSATTAREKARRGFALFEYMSRLVERKRAAPADDLLSDLVTAYAAGGVTRTELIDLALAVLTAGYETTVGQLGLSLHSFLVDPEPPDGLRDPRTAPPVVEEYLRLTPATPMTFPRVAVVDVRLGGVTVRAGEAVVVSLLRSNRDDVVFPDADGLVPAGRDATHLTFGHGAHFCLGAGLARAQLNIALPTLLRRLPELRLTADADAVRWSTGLATCGPTRLRATW